ncbi:MAG: HEPN domain-containing protein [Magnetococcales bacterium]|nr:HEPN domain-containing protein [Magnetococcales bacterium]
MIPWDEVHRLLRKADQDRAVFHAIKNLPGIDAATACFHAQQAVEKCLKAVLLRHGTTFRRTHDLDELVDLVMDHGIPFPFAVDHFSLLNPFAVLLRYEELDVAGLTSKEAERLMEDARRWAGDRLENEVDAS